MHAPKKFSMSVEPDPGSDATLVTLLVEGNQRMKRYFSMAPGETMTFRVRDGEIVFEAHTAAQPYASPGGIVAALMGGAS